MRKILKLENDSVVVRVSKTGFPECFVYSDNYFPAPDFVGSADRVVKVIVEELRQAMSEMKKSNKKAVKISFEFADFAENFFDAKRISEKELEMF